MYASKPVSVRLLLAWVLALCAGLAMAQTNDRDQEQLKRLKLQLRQMQQEQSTLQAAVQQAQTDLAKEKALAQEAIKAAQEESRLQQGASSRRVSALRAQVSSLTQDKTSLTEQFDQLQKQFQQHKEETSAQAKQQQEQHGRTVADWQGRHQQQVKLFEDCRAQNAQLYTLGADLLQRYENKGLPEVLATKEPFVQTARVQLENVKAQYQDQLDAAKLKKDKSTQP